MNEVLESVWRLQVNAFIVRKGSKGLRTSKIENKIALRCVPERGHLPGRLLRPGLCPPARRQLLQGVDRAAYWQHSECSSNSPLACSCVLLLTLLEAAIALACSKEAFVQVLMPWVGLCLVPFCRAKRQRQRPLISS